MASFLVFYTLNLLAMSPLLRVAPLETYIVHTPAPMKPSNFASFQDWHASLVFAVVGTHATLVERILYSYETTLQGFAARLTYEEVATLQSMACMGVISKDQVSQLHTTRGDTITSSHNI